MSAFSYVQLQANADAGLNYLDVGLNNNAAPATDSSPIGTVGFARIGVNVTAGAALVFDFNFYPLTTGNLRPGDATSTAVAPGIINTSYQRLTSFAWSDTSTNCTFITLSVTAATLTGKLWLYGVRA